MQEQYDANKSNELTIDEIADLVADKLKLVNENYLVTLDVEPAIQMLAAITSRIEAYYTTYCEQANEIHNQKEDLDHLLASQKINGDPDDVISDTMTRLTDTVILRRNMKDAKTSMRVIIENLEKTRGFLRGMVERRYTPKSERYSSVGTIRANITNPTVEESYATHLKQEYSGMVTMLKDRRERQLDTTDISPAANGSRPTAPRISPNSMKPIRVPHPYVEVKEG